MSETKYKILVCDDIATMRKVVTEGLRAQGYRKFAEAEDGEAGWSLLTTAEEPIDCIICDLNMPGGSGLEFLKRVRGDERYREVPFIMLTASSEKGHVAEALKSGVNAYVLKPFSANTLASKVSAVRRGRDNA